MLEVRDLAVDYGKHVALQGVSLDVAQGETVVILGANGAGKSTLLKSVAGLVQPREGAAIRFAGESLAGRLAHEIPEVGIALVPEGRGVFADLTVSENLLLGAYPRRARKDEATNLAMVLDLFPRLAERRRQIVSTMSGGEQQMVAIGRALMSAPRLLMLDEPSLGLAPVLVGELFDALAKVGRRGVAPADRRAERPHQPVDRRARISAGGRAHGRRRTGGQTDRRPRGTARIPRRGCRRLRLRRRTWTSWD